MSTRINGNDLISIGYKESELIGIALKINKKRTGYTRDEMLIHYKNVLENTTAYIDDKLFGDLAFSILNEGNKIKEDVIPLIENPNNYQIYGEINIEEGAINQMNIAMKLPVTVAGALMPDAHQGYGLPIGGVLATKNAIIPYGVGVDIGCRMALSIFDVSDDFFNSHYDVLKNELINHTLFGAGQGFRGQYKSNHDILDRSEFNLTPFVKSLQDKAAAQLGSSGGGNHFVEWGILEFKEKDEILNIEKGKYLALLTHSGSRGFGATIAGHYTKLAKEICKLPHEAKNLAYLDFNSEVGQEYWIAMNLAGDYASACHDIIHHKLANAIGVEVLAKVENHHNFAWKETWNNEEVIVHRKGATPADKNTMGIIPGSMTSPGFLVRGKGVEASINSASHGAGRVMSRTQAIKNITHSEMKKILEDHGVYLIGAGLDEAPMAYKNIHQVMESQKELVNIIAQFNPKIVRMADDGSKED